MGIAKEGTFQKHVPDRFTRELEPQLFVDPKSYREDDGLADYFVIAVSGGKENKPLRYVDGVEARLPVVGRSTPQQAAAALGTGQEGFHEMVRLALNHKLIDIRAQLRTRAAQEERDRREREASESSRAGIAVRKGEPRPSSRRKDYLGSL